MWDTSSSERFWSITKTYFNGASCALIVYYVTQPDTLTETTNWIKDLREYAPENIILVLCGNKTDLADK